MDNPSGNNVIRYRIGWNITTAGVPASWSTDRTVDTTNIGTESQGLGIAIRDTVDSGTAPEMFVFWVDNPFGANAVYYKVGWNLNAAGNPTSWSARITPGIAPGDETQGLGISIENWLDAANVDILVFWIDNPFGNNHGYYRTGEDVTSTGTADWTRPRDTFPNDWQGVGTETQGAGATLLNIGGAGLDVSFAWVDNPFGTNSAYLRSEWGGRMGTESHN
jgi:hypothetical protein